MQEQQSARPGKDANVVRVHCRPRLTGATAAVSPFNRARAASAAAISLAVGCTSLHSKTSADRSTFGSLAVGLSPDFGDLLCLPDIVVKTVLTIKALPTRPRLTKQAVCVQRMKTSVSWERCCDHFNHSRTSLNLQARIGRFRLLLLTQTSSVLTVTVSAMQATAINGNKRQQLLVRAYQEIFEHMHGPGETKLLKCTPQKT